MNPTAIAWGTTESPHDKPRDAGMHGDHFEDAFLDIRRIEEQQRGAESVKDKAMQEHFIARVGMVEWPDGTVTMQYAFRHALYQEVLYERVGAVRRVRLHRQLGERKEASYGGRAVEIAGELAVHFTQERNDRRAARYHDAAQGA